MSDRVTFAIVEGSHSASAWARLEQHHAAVADRHLRDLFAEDPARGERLTVEAEGILLDYSKHRVTDETMRLLVELAEASGLRERIDAMFSGERINVTENRAVLHVALRAPAGEVDRGRRPGRRARRARGAGPDGSFADAVRDGSWTGHTGKPIRNVVNIGIGGSDLGPVMAYEALRALQRRAA